MKIAGIQFACSEDKEKNIEKALKMLSVAFSEGAKIICFQELFNLRWFPKDRNEKVFEMAESIDGNTVALFKNKIKGTDAVVILPIFEKADDKYFNTSVILQGENIIGFYRKIHVTDIPLWEEKYYFSQGDTGFPVFDTLHGKIGHSGIVGQFLFRRDQNTENEWRRYYICPYLMCFQITTYMADSYFRKCNFQWCIYYEGKQSRE